ncbi:MAG: PEP-CTERM sorting domain-containing protein [Gammaproteobacteria bacterium]|nr:PEP-CTERM sorting domain-containing protein [Gammaproteobacteria bacterium]
MKKLSVIAAMASVAAVTAVMSAPVAAMTCGSSACAQVHNRWVQRPVVHEDTPTGGTSVPEPGVLPLMLLGLGGVGFLALRRRGAAL